jgi:mono/diheme cytochrome c family protein
VSLGRARAVGSVGAALAAIAGAFLAPTASAGAPGRPGWATRDTERIARGRAVYETACLACHGADGAGNPEWESDVRPVPFDDCGTIAEPTELWKSIVVHGGPKHGLSDVMPAFGDAFSGEELGAVVAYLRTFCSEADRYPPGDLNFRRLIRTGKAFPEAEVVLSAEIVPDERETELEVAYENRIGPRFQYEVELPVRPAANREGLAAGAGDLTFLGKYVLHFDPERGRILSAGLGVDLPTGSEGKELSEGTAVFRPFVAFGQSFGRTVLQARAAVHLPADTARSSRVLRYAVGYSLPPIGMSRTGYVPAVELLGEWNRRTDRHAATALFGVSKALNKLGHVIASVGVAIPFRPVRGPTQIHAYLLWDFGDGPFWAGW